MFVLVLSVGCFSLLTQTILSISRFSYHWLNISSTHNSMLASFSYFIPIHMFPISKSTNTGLFNRFREFTWEVGAGGRGWMRTAANERRRRPPAIRPISGRCGTRRFCRRFCLRFCVLGTGGHRRQHPEVVHKNRWQKTRSDSGVGRLAWLVPGGRLHYFTILSEPLLWYGCTCSASFVKRGWKCCRKK